jgi:hypothetical protein
VLLYIKVPEVKSRNITLTVVVALAWNIAKAIALIGKSFQLLIISAGPGWGRWEIIDNAPG